MLSRGHLWANRPAPFISAKAKTSNRIGAPNHGRSFVQFACEKLHQHQGAQKAQNVTPHVGAAPDGCHGSWRDVLVAMGREPDTWSAPPTKDWLHWFARKIIETPPAPAVPPASKFKS
eukprot:SAG31_NODE_5496_length_2501_cov_1.820566_3_plen_118_part_00